MYSFLGKTLLTGKDVAPDFLQQKGASKIKALVGGDLLQCEKKGGSHFQVRGDFNVVVTCNSNLRVRLEGDNEAWGRRLLAINYERPKPAVRIADFAEKLIAEEGEGILNFFVEGALQHLEELSTRGDYTLSDDQSRRVQTILRESDSVRQFVEGMVVRQDGCDLTIPELVAAYYGYCENRGWHAYPAHHARSSLRELMLEIHHVNQRNDVSRDGKDQRGYRHVAFRQEGT